MLKDKLKVIKDDMKCVRNSKKYLKEDIKTAIKELEEERKERLAEFSDYDENNDFRMWNYKHINKSFKQRKEKIINDLYEDWHNCQTYYLIYKDGSEVYITAEEILSGEKFPKLKDIVYASIQSADDSFDTEIGNTDWYSDERLENYSIEEEDENKWQYETAIQFKYKTAWAARYSEKYPDFVPQKI